MHLESPNIPENNRPILCIQSRQNMYDNEWEYWVRVREHGKRRQAVLYEENLKKQKEATVSNQPAARIEPVPAKPQRRICSGERGPCGLGGHRGQSELVRRCFGTGEARVFFARPLSPQVCPGTPSLHSVPTVQSCLLYKQLHFAAFMPWLGCSPKKLWRSSPALLWARLGSYGC